MFLILVAIAVGILGGLAMGGRWRRLGDLRFKWWGLAFLGLGLQLVPVPSRPGQVDHWVAVGLLVASYIVLLVFVVANIRLPGFPLIAAGFALNALVISINGGMPVSDRALHVAAGPYFVQTKARLTEHGGAKHHLRRPDDDLVGLSDVIPLGPPFRQVMSAGDVLWLLGTAWVIARGMSKAADPADRDLDGARGAAPLAE